MTEYAIASRYRRLWIIAAVSLCVLAAAAILLRSPTPDAGGIALPGETGGDSSAGNTAETTPRPAAPVTGDAAEPAAAGDPGVLFCGAQYVRTNGDMGESHTRTKVIRSREELEAYYEENKGTFDLERRQTVYADSTPGFLDACDLYDDAFFAARDLLIVVLEEGSGSIRHEITSLRHAGEGQWLLEGFCLTPEVGTCDMAQWHILCEIAKGVVQERDAIELKLKGLAMARDLTSSVVPGQTEPSADLAADSAKMTDFAVRLLQNTLQEGKNTLISPLSVLAALSMTAQGAEGETLVQMETVLGLSRDQLASWFHDYMALQTDSLKLANAIWFKNDDKLMVEQAFLQKNADYFGADAFKAAFDDSTVDTINHWVQKNTDGMIDGILQELPDSAVMCLVNALSFEAEWTDAYSEFDVWEQTFTREDGTKETVEMMASTQYTFLETEKSTGFVKYYKGGNYAFAALLPNEGMTVAELVASLNGESLHTALAHPADHEVRTRLPKFETASSFELTNVLKAMGMPNAFDPESADFSSIGTNEEGRLCIDQVLHKTYLYVGEKGTRAGAAAAVMPAPGSPEDPPEPRVVHLDRPFLYMLVDCETNLPVFIGACMTTQP